MVVVGLQYGSLRAIAAVMSTGAIDQCQQSSLEQ